MPIQPRIKAKSYWRADLPCLGLQGFNLHRGRARVGDCFAGHPRQLFEFGRPGVVFFDGIDTRWSRVPGAESVVAELHALVDAYEPERPERSVQRLKDCPQQ